MQQVLKKVYEDDTDAAAVCELLVDLDEGMQEWRYHHVKSSSHSHSMVPGGLLVTSSTTRLTSGTSLVTRVEILASTS